MKIYEVGSGRPNLFHVEKEETVRSFDHLFICVRFKSQITLFNSCKFVGLH